MTRKGRYANGTATVTIRIRPKGKRRVVALALNRQAKRIKPPSGLK